MTVAAEQARAAKTFASLLELELGHRIDIHSWVQQGAPNTAVYATSHPEGEPTRVKECDRATHAFLTYDGPADGIASVADCQAQAGSWYYDAATETLYVHTSGGNSPATAGAYYVMAYFWECHCDGQYEGARALYFNGVLYRPDLDASALPEVTDEASMFSEGGIKQSFGAVKILNADGFYDTRIADPALTSLTGYVYAGKNGRLKKGVPGEVYAAFVTIWEGRTGNLRLNDRYFEISTEDARLAAD